MVDKFEGLTEEEAQRRLIKFGENSVRTQAVSAWQIFLRQFTSPIVYLLILAAVISFYVGEISDGIVISIIIVINSFLGFINEYRASKTVEELEKFITTKSTVIRDNTRKVIDRKYLVPGDIVILKLGDIAPADGIILEAGNLLVDESGLTGESEPIHKRVNESEDQAFTEGILFSGSYIKGGTAAVKVFATGTNSKFGKITDLSVNTTKKTEYEKEVQSLSKGFLYVGILFLIIILTAHIILKQYENFSSILLFTIAITITIIPEALPIITTLSLSHYAAQLGKKGVITKRLTAIEDLGNLDIICSDKTGTLTKNELKVEKFLADKKDDFLKYSLLGTAGGSDPIEIAIEAYLKKNKFINTLATKEFEDIPFDPDLKYSGRKFNDYSILKGAPEYIISHCKNIPDKDSLLKDIERYSYTGYRAVSFCFETKEVFKYLGTYLLIDEIKEDAAGIIQLAEAKKIKIKIITGDAKAVATYVGKHIGLVDRMDEVVDAAELSFDDEMALNKQVEEYTIFSRTDPIQKFKIIQALQKKHSVGYLGDGINDAPSLKLADVSMVVDTASDIAKSTADIIITRKNLKVIIEGVMEGRQAFENINKYVKHTLIGNFGNFFTIGVLSVFIKFLPILPIQILVNNLLIDIPSLAYATDNVGKKDITKPKHNNTYALIKVCLLLGAISSIFDFVFFFTLRNNVAPQLQTMWFIFSTLTELFIIFSIRTKKSIVFASKPSFFLIGSTLFSIIFVLYTGLVGVKLLQISIVPYHTLSYLLVLAMLYLSITELVKYVYYKIVRE